MDERVGRVSALWRFPVKSMLGERLDRAVLTRDGVVGDRAYAIVDQATGKVVSAKSARLFPGMLACRAALVEEPRAGTASPPVVIVLPDGSRVTSDQPDCDELLSSHFARRVHLAAAASDGYTIDQYHPDVEGADPAGHRDTVVETKLGSAFFADIGAPSPVTPTAFFDLFPVSMLTSSTLAALGALRPQSRFDARRFRMNVIVDTEPDGFVENAWVGRGVGLGEEARVHVAMPDPRCVMPTLAQEELPRDDGVLRTLVRHNRLELEEGARFPCAGVYAVVDAPGTVGRGDVVTTTS